MVLVAPMADLEARMHDVAAERLANAVVDRGGAPADFTARLSSRDRDAFDIAIGATHTLRYPSSVQPVVGKGDELNVNGIRYRVIDPPRRLNAYEMTAELVAL